MGQVDGGEDLLAAVLVGDPKHLPQGAVPFHLDVAGVDRLEGGQGAGPVVDVEEVGVAVEEEVDEDQLHPFVLGQTHRRAGVVEHGPVDPFPAAGPAPVGLERKGGDGAGEEGDDPPQGGRPQGVFLGDRHSGVGEVPDPQVGGQGRVRGRELRVRPRLDRRSLFLAHRA